MADEWDLPGAGSREQLREVLGRTVDATKSVGTASGGFRIDVEQARSLIPKLEDAAERLQVMRQRLDPAKQGSMFLDEVGANFIAQLRTMTGSAAEYVVVWHKQIVDTAEALRTQLVSYANADSQARIEP